MTDSGVETGNDSNDSFATHDSQSTSHDINPLKHGSSLSVLPSLPINNMPVNKPSTADLECSSINKEQIEDKVPDFLLPLQRPIFEIDPPAGLLFHNLQCSSLGLANGYEVVGNGHSYALAVYQNAKLKRKLLAVRRHFKNARDAWLQFKGPLDERKLRHSASTNNVELLSSLLAAGIDPNCSDDQQRSALHIAACRGYSDVIRILLDNGADPNQKDSQGNTPLHLAACTNNVAVVTLLLRAGTDITSSDYYGRNPLQLAQSKLKLLQQSTSYDSLLIKQQVQQVIEMMLEVLQKRGQDLEAELLSAFSSRLTLSQTKQEVETEVRDLLTSLSSLSLSKS